MPNWPAIHYGEKFDHDEHHRVVRHHLPEGGLLHYQWGIGGQLLGVHWVKGAVQPQVVIQGIPGLPGYRYGNGLWIRTLSQQNRVSILAVTDGETPVWEHHQLSDQHNRLQYERHHMPAANHQETWSYAYDAQSRLS